MGDDSGDKPRVTTTETSRSALSADEVRVLTDRAPRCAASVAVVCTSTDGGAIEGALVNVSASGMFMASSKLFEIGTKVTFEFKLDDGLAALRGSAEVMRRELRGMGLRFLNLEGTGPEMLARLVEATAGAEPDTAISQVEFGHGSVLVRLSATTARYFTYNPLLHIGVGGCFLPSASVVPLGTGYDIKVVDAEDRVLLRCQAKVAATQEGRVGLRFIEPDRTALRSLRAEIARLSGKPATKLAPVP